MKKVLITGAAGFLGSHLCDKFINREYFVIGMDNLITGSLKNIEHMLWNFFCVDLKKMVLFEISEK